MTQFEPHIVPSEPEIVTESPEEPELSAAPVDLTTEGSPPRRRVGNIVLTSVTVVVIAGAIVAAAIGMQSFSSASDARDRTAALNRDRRATETRRHEAEHTINTMNAAAAKVPSAFNALGQSLDAVVAAQHNVVAVHNRGAAAYNAGDERGSIAVYTNDGAVAIAAFDAKAASAKTALDNATAAAHDLEEALNG